jgi:hypothetical protein
VKILRVTLTKRRRKRLRNVLVTGNVCDVYNSFDIVVDLAITSSTRFTSKCYVPRKGNNAPS